MRPNKAKAHFLRNLDLPSLLEPAGPKETNFTATKVTVTVGPACQDVDTLAQLLEAGATCARCDLTWGPLEFHKASLDNLAEAMRRCRKLCAVMLDTVGRELVIKREARLDERGWPVHGASLTVKAGWQVVLTVDDIPEVQGSASAPTVLPISYPKFTAMAQPGDTIFLGRYLVTGADDSSCYLEVVEIAGSEVRCVAKNDAVLDGLLTVFHTERSESGLANVQNDLPILCEHDKAALAAFGAAYEIDFVSLSFTRSADDVLVTRAFLDSIGLQSTKIIAKIESRQALFHFKQIALAADGVMLSRGNLGLDVLPEKMALVQKAVISDCNALGKPCIITRVVDTMAHTPRPTRAEATDVANAVLDGCDAILLGAETLRGRYPVATVETILHICKQAEKVFDHKHYFEELMQDAMDSEDADDDLRDMAPTRSASSDSLAPSLPRTMSTRELPSPVSRRPTNTPYLSKLESIASSAVRASEKVQAALIIVYTQTGTTAHLVSKYRPPVPIMTLVVPQLKSDSLTWRLEGRGTARQCQIGRGLLPVLAAPSPSGETLLEEAVLMASRNGLVKPRDHIVVVQRISDAFVVKIVSVDDRGTGIKNIRPKSLVDMMKAAAGITDDGEADLGNELSLANNGGAATGATLGAGASPALHNAYVRTLSHMDSSRGFANGTATPK